jgi:hypothetical protein
MCFAYPKPEFPTPSFEYHTAFNGVAFGIVRTPFLTHYCLTNKFTAPKGLNLLMSYWILVRLKKISVVLLDWKTRVI